MDKVNRLLEFEIDTPSDEELAEMFRKERQMMAAELDHQYKASPPDYRGSGSKHHVARNAQQKRKAKRKAQRKARARA